MAEIWEQRPDESAVAYGAFLFFRESRPPRSVLKCYREWTKDPGKKKASGRWTAWATQYQWHERAMEYDLHVDGIRRAAKEKVVAEVHEQRAREIETSALSTLKETASLAHASIKDIVEWDETGKVTRVIPSKDLPNHVAAAISKISVVHDKQGNPNLTIEMHGKVRPLDLLGQHYSLWEDAKDQAQRAQTNAFLELLDLIKSGALDTLPRGDWPEPSLKNPPPWITVEIPGVTKDTKK